MLYPVFVVAVLASLVVGGARWAWEEATKPPKPETAEHKISRAQTACTMALSTTERVDTVTKLLRLR